MSRIAKYPITLPKGVDVSILDGVVAVKGNLGSLTQQLLPGVSLSIDNQVITCRADPAIVSSGAMSGTMRALVNNMVTGVSVGYQKRLSLVGVGYRAQAQGRKLNLTLGFSHPVLHEMPEGITVETPTQTEIVIKGIDKQVVGQVAAEVRAYRPPEPYKGKGVRYANETVVIKETKKK